MPQEPWCVPFSTALRTRVRRCSIAEHTATATATASATRSMATIVHQAMVAPMACVVAWLALLQHVLLVDVMIVLAAELLVAYAVSWRSPPFLASQW